eukprot:1483876-Rhodomonas_salina.1
MGVISPNLECDALAHARSVKEFLICRGVSRDGADCIRQGLTPVTLLLCPARYLLGTDARVGDTGHAVGEWA